VGQRHLKTFREFVVLRYLGEPNKGACFWTTADKTGGDNTSGISADTGKWETWYEEVCFTDDPEFAKDVCSRRCLPRESPSANLQYRSDLQGV
jgi:hypothetical protein